ncbi:hypothetical protein AUR04nite_00790 [Glutamicibacter uratoxydans]|uniref:Uncharacterized protein n=1 Tax=Glutamicibacter uratoxydans TaxID=43667 RepID=A0A4Y4DIU4_GLUUR|nr:hypothetical protein [Glutamicibacter uratoxydans]GED04547.1 hypothetical protein AUR04nite_00790 [Glutamicibacter uratoxydans]
MSMSANQLEETIAEAQRFVAKAQHLCAKQKQHEKDVANDDLHWSEWTDVSPKDTGAVRRASMDLTRSLADLRRV